MDRDEFNFLVRCVLGYALLKVLKVFCAFILTINQFKKIGMLDFGDKGKRSFKSPELLTQADNLASHRPGTFSNTTVTALNLIKYSLVLR